MKNEKMKRIDEELVCVDSLAHNLMHLHGCSDVNVHREPNDPPDFWINVDGQRYAAEVTSIVKEQAYHATCTLLKDMAKKRATDEGGLVGTYCLKVIRHPDLPRRNSTEWSALVGKVLSFIQNTVSVESTGESFLLDDQQGHLSIQKKSADGATVGLIGAPEAKWEGEINNELQELMQEAVTTKRKKLEKKGVPGNCPRNFLVLYDAYGYGSAEDAKKALLCTDGYDWFHSVFWATSFTDRDNMLYPGNPEREGTFLYSKINK
ncbi:MAG: hypothetical protein JRE64_20505 [Deltaproteobacteria bacterium]|nr:hypothetical protein [Deltaproteobacteria bacterium]